jgi:uncharacterized integral membrane protein
MQIFLFIALVISALAVIFALQNSASVEVTFLTWQFNSSLALVLLIALAAGALISVLFSLPSNLKTRWTIRQQRKKLGELEANLADARLQLEQAQTHIEMIETKLTLVESRNAFSDADAQAELPSGNAAPAEQPKRTLLMPFSPAPQEDADSEPE